jgi:ABC-type Fe3+/spermidine/putrescine transport system ATPase subunit
MNAPGVSVRDVAKRFGSHPALTGVSIDIARGEFVVIVGPSGCGKTTLLRLISGLDVPDSGEVWLKGRQVSGPRRSLVPAHERGVGFVFQDLALWPHMTVQQNLAFVLERRRLSRSDRLSKVGEALALARVDAFAGRYPHELSGGEQQRVALARALVGSPELLLLDEPLSSLDPELRDALRDELGRLQTATGVTAIYVTHDRKDAAALADRVIEMRAGQIVRSTPM